MASKSHDLTHGPLVQQIILFSLPLMATNVLQVLFNMSDVAVVGQFAGPEALGSVGSTSILVSLFTGFLIGMGSGSTSSSPGISARGTTRMCTRRCIPR